MVAFYNDRGVTLQYDPDADRGIGGLVGDYDQELVAETPPRVRVSYEYDGDRLQVLVDEALTVLEVTEA